MKHPTKQAFALPNPVGLVTVAEGESSSNIVTIAWVGMACSDPVTVTIAVRPSRHSHELLLEEGEFVLNIPGEELLDAVDLCGRVSGGDSDKWELAGLTPEPALEVRAPLISECPYALECRVIEMLELGAHDLFVARVLTAHADERILDERGRLDYEAFKPLGYLPYEYRGIGPRLEPSGAQQS
jgi:flavin reductase (DIM6/NTAB) family NADH-FMN oxidoreductase RutF